MLLPTRDFIKLITSVWIAANTYCMLWIVLMKSLEEKYRVFGGKEMLSVHKPTMLKNPGRPWEPIAQHIDTAPPTSGRQMVVSRQENSRRQQPTSWAVGNHGKAVLPSTSRRLLMRGDWPPIAALGNLHTNRHSEPSWPILSREPPKQLLYFPQKFESSPSVVWIMICAHRRIPGHLYTLKEENFTCTLLVQTNVQPRCF